MYPLDERHTLGIEQEITLDIKPTTTTALILSAANAKGDYLVLEMVDGSVSCLTRAVIKDLDSSPLFTRERVGLSEDLFV